MKPLLPLHIPAAINPSLRGLPQVSRAQALWAAKGWFSRSYAQQYCASAVRNRPRFAFEPICCLEVYSPTEPQMTYTLTPYGSVNIISATLRPHAQRQDSNSARSNRAALRRTRLTLNPAYTTRSIHKRTLSEHQSSSANYSHSMVLGTTI